MVVGEGRGRVESQFGEGGKMVVGGGGGKGEDCISATGCNDQIAHP